MINEGILKYKILKKKKFIIHFLKFIHILFYLKYIFFIIYFKEFLR